MRNFIRLTADDEMPVCERCENCNEENVCENRCGPKYGWHSYIRITEEEA